MTKPSDYDGRGYDPPYTTASEQMKPPMFAYTFHFSVDVGGVIPSYGKVLNEVNRYMADFGFDLGKLVARNNDALATTVSPLPKLAQADLDTIGWILLTGLREHRPEWDVRLEHVTCSEVKE